MAKGVQANWIHRGAPRPANPVRRHPAKSVWTVVILIMILDVDVTAEGGIIKLIARRAIQIKKAVKMAVLKFHQWNELLKSSIQKKDKIPVTAMKIICKKIFANSPALCYNSPAGMARLF